MQAQTRPFHYKLAALILPLLAVLALTVWAISAVWTMTAGGAIRGVASRQKPSGTGAAGQDLRRPAIVTSVDRPDEFQSALP